MNALEGRNIETLTPAGTGEIILYQSDNSIRLEVRVEDETVWLTQMQMAELFQTTIPNVNMHIKNIFREGELEENSVVKDFLITATDGKNYNTKHYNLDVIISVGYRVKSFRGTTFRRWATKMLKQVIIKGYAFNQRIERTENIMLETQQRVTETERKIDILSQHVEDILSDFNDINEDTRMKLELINQSLAELQIKNRLDNTQNPNWN